MTANERKAKEVAMEVMSEMVGGSINSLMDYPKGDYEYESSLAYLTQDTDDLVRDLVERTMEELTRENKNVKFVGNDFLTRFIKKDLKQDNLEQYQKLVEKKEVEKKEVKEIEVNGKVYKLRKIEDLGTRIF